MATNEPFEIDVSGLSARLDSDNPPVIVDVREPWELEIAAVEGALAIPLGEVTRRAAEIPRDRPVAVMCHHGGRSAQAASTPGRGMSIRPFRAISRGRPERQLWGSISV